MPKLATSSLPKYRRHRASGQAVVTLDGRDFYLGPHGSGASEFEYDRLIGEWLAAGRRLPPGAQQPSLTITEMLLLYWKFAEQHYRKHGEPTGELVGIRYALRPLRELYGLTLITDFGPLALKSIQRVMIERNVSRGVINSRIGKIKRVFRWAVSEQLAPAGTLHALQAVAGLQRGRTNARETAPVLPVSNGVLERTLPHLPPVMQAMVQFQRLVGCRPGEACSICPGEVDCSGDVWTYRPSRYKSEHCGRGRIIYIGPQAQDVLRPYMSRPAEQRCFRPVDSERLRKSAMRERRKTKVQPSQVDRSKASDGRRPGERYTRQSYARAIARACGNAGVERWSPNQLRHSRGTEIRKLYGVEGAQVVLGHAKADVTQVYAERDAGLALKIAMEIG
jgi:integrase